MKKLLCGSLFLSMILPGAAQTAASENCSQLVRKHCLSCHSETRICQKIKKNKGKRAWKRTIKRMTRHGAQIEKKDIKELTACLSSDGITVPTLCSPAQ